jgi:hypothetical protein
MTRVEIMGLLLCLDVKEGNVFLSVVLLVALASNVISLPSVNYYQSCLEKDNPWWLKARVYPEEDTVLFSVFRTYCVWLSVTQTRETMLCVSRVSLVCISTGLLDSYFPPFLSLIHSSFSDQRSLICESWETQRNKTSAIKPLQLCISFGT